MGLLSSWRIGDSFLKGQFLRKYCENSVPFLMKLKLKVYDIRQVEIISFLLERDILCSADLFYGYLYYIIYIICTAYLYGVNTKTFH